MGRLLACMSFSTRTRNTSWRIARAVLQPSVALLALLAASVAIASAPVPLLERDRPVDWWFAYKFNGASFPGCETEVARACRFDSKSKKPKTYVVRVSQQYVFASSNSTHLAKGAGCLGMSTSDPLGATFDRIYFGDYNYVIWTDQPYGHPKIPKCTSGGNCPSPWGHAKGMVAWDENGSGVVLQVTTPSWPAAGSDDHPRGGEQNTLGCLKHNNIKLSQHFFALRLTKGDLLLLLDALRNASAPTDPNNSQLVRNGGPTDVQDRVRQLGVRIKSTTVTRERLSTGVEVISKPSSLHVPPWQMVSALLGGVRLRTATYWSTPFIPTTTNASPIGCWDKRLGDPGGVQVATSGQWEGTVFSLKGGSNHAKIGVSVSGDRHYAILGDLNQQGAISKDCHRSQNGRGGLFFVVEDRNLNAGIRDLIDGDTAPTKLKK